MLEEACHFVEVGSVVRSSAELVAIHVYSTYALQSLKFLLHYIFSNNCVLLSIIFSSTQI